jgi:hypothetical protein
MKLSLICERELFIGCFGMDESGTQPICGYELIEEVEPECLIEDNFGIRPSYSVICPQCGLEHDWPDSWDIVN